jgi:sodium/potassium-transporting ATPase subunit alpha
LADSAEAGKTPIQRELERFIKLFIIIGCSMGLAVFCINFAYARPILTNFIFVIGIIVANVPEGLLITVTVSMALAA